MATTVVHADLPALSRKAEVIVRATVSRVESRWNGDHSRILTQVDLAVAEVLKGPDSQTVTLILPGGIVGDLGQHVAGVPSFQRGEDVVLFLSPHGGRAFRITGFSQGKYRLERGEGGELMALPADDGGARIIDPATGEERVAPREAMPYAQLKLRIREALGSLTPPADSEPGTGPLKPRAPGETR